MEYEYPQTVPINHCFGAQTNEIVPKPYLIIPC